MDHVAQQAADPGASQPAEAGRRGPDVRSDCWVRITPAGSGGIDLQLRTKVEVMYGDAVRRLVQDVLGHLGVPHARVEMEDAGALPWVQMARLEAAVRRLAAAGLRGTPSAGSAPAGPDGVPEYLPEFAAQAQYPTRRDRFRRSRLYLPGNEPKFMLNAGLHAPDGIILDLEDSVVPAAKDEARLLVRNALRCVDFRGAERMVRINQGERGLADLDVVAAHNVHVILIPKCESAEHVRAVEGRSQGHAAAETRRHEVERRRPAGQDEGECGRPARRRSEEATKPRSDAGADGAGESPAPGRPLLMPIIESALGAIRAYEIATASPQICGLTIGLEDYTADIGTQRTSAGRESFWARCQVVNAARAAGVQPIDTVFSDVADLEGLRASVLEAKALGFEGKGCIHPRQIRLIHEAFAPSPAELEKAQKIVAAYHEAQARGLGVVALGSKMIDPPVVKRALRLVQLAEALGQP
jgi:citrate lyase subunit beta/citryl-CoA lyase